MGVGLRDVMVALREGYPSLRVLGRMLDGFEKISSLADLLSMTMGTVSKVDRLLVTYLGRDREEKRENRELGGEKEEVVL